MSNIKQIILYSFIIISINGCSTIFKPIKIDASPPLSVSVDAKQRLVIAIERKMPGEAQGKTIVCAEPSPDAFRALAASGGANVALAGKEIGGSGGMAEHAGALAMRTQTIQLLRDGLYRACEAYMNGAIDEGMYQRIIAGYDEVLITLVALEGMGRQPVGPLPSLGTKSAGNQTNPAASGETGGTGSSTSGSAESIATTTVVPQGTVIEKHTAEMMHAIVRDYYCFQISMKQLFYGTRQGGKAIPPEALKGLCGP